MWIEAQCHAVLATILAYRGDWELGRPPPRRAPKALAASHDSIEARYDSARIAAAALGRAQTPTPDRSSTPWATCLPWPP